MANEPEKPFEQTASVNTTESAGQKSEPPSPEAFQTQKESAQNSPLCSAVKAAEGIGGMAGDAAVQTAVGVGSALGAVAQTGKELGEAIAKQAAEAGQSAFDSATEVADAAARQAQQMFEQATKEAGKAADFLGGNPVLRNILRAFRADWLLSAFGQVDLDKARETVKKLQQENPDETPNQIAHRIILEKVMYAGGIGLASSILPGVALALLAVDVAITTVLQAEMVYEIAAAYGLDLKDPARKGEVLAIFGLSIGGSQAIKTGTGLLRNVPLAGMAIGASTNAVMLYTLGYAACRFYEAKTNPLTSQAAAAAIEKESQDYLEKAIAQQGIMDRILVHAILASNPDKSRADILAELPKLNLTPASQKAIAENIQSPQPLEALLELLDRDFAMPLLAQCYRIARLDGVTSEREARLLNAIASKFDLDLKAIETAVRAEADASQTTRQ